MYIVEINLSIHTYTLYTYTLYTYRAKIGGLKMTLSIHITHTYQGIHIQRKKKWRVDNDVIYTHTHYTHTYTLLKKEEGW